MARRTENIAPFFVMEIVKQAVALQAAGHPVIHLSIGEPDFTAPAPVVEALASAARRGRTQYTEATGIAPLRAAISAHYASRYGAEIDPARIVVTAGASAALTLACAALVNPGDEVLVADPSYPCNRHFIAAYDGVPRAIPTTASGRFQLDATAVEGHWTPATRGVLLSTPANPTGTSIAPAELHRILETVRARGGFSIVDEIYLGLSYVDDATTALTMRDDIVVTDSFSKYFHMTGWRLGWMVVPMESAPVFEKLAQNLYICASSLAQQAALACFEPASIAEFERRKAEFRRRRDWLVPALCDIGLDVPAPPDGAFYVYADISRFGNDSMDFALAMLRDAHVAVVPGADFGTHDAARYVRISYANSMENLQEAVRRLERFVGRRRSAA